MPRFIIADQDPQFRDACRRTLAARGYQVKVVADQSQCLQQCQARTSKVLLMDAKLFWDHEMGVLDWLKHNHDPDLVTVLLVNQEPTEPVPASLRHVVSAQVPRPASTDEFDQFLSRLEDEVWWARNGQYLY